MKKGTGSGNYQNYILTLLVLAVNVLLLGFCFDFYYDLNDDTMMLDIMAGAYSGTPDGHNMQTLYPLGAVIALCYRVWGSVPWYGLFLCLCQFGCFWLAAVRLCALTEQAGGRAAADGAGARRGFSIGKKLLLLLVWSLFVWGVCLAHVVNIQYTVTSAMLSATALFLFLTARDTDNVRRFLFQNIPSVVLVILAYQLRSEMLLLTFPFICLAGLCRLTGEKRIFERTNFFKYGGVLGIMLAGMLLSGGIDYGAYGSAQWQDFLKFFEARTTVYDFYPELVTEESYGAQLSDLGVPAYQQALLRNYDYGLDETIDTAFLTKLAGYATKTLRGAKDWSGIVKEQAYRYFYRTFRGGDRPYSTLLLLLYAAVLAAGCRGLCGQKRPGVRSYAFLWQLALLAAGRTAVWMFILLRGRDPERITHSLYLVEYALLAALAARMIPGAAAAGVSSGQDRQQETGGRARRLWSGILAGILLAAVMLSGGSVAGSIAALQVDQAQREAVNRDWQAIDEYCRAHKENFYFEDVYSTVGFSRKIFDGVPDGGYANYDILGGWMCNSPLYYEKIGRYGIESAQQGLLEQDNVYWIMSDTEVAQQGFGWLTDYYDAQGITVTVEETDRIGEAYAVYRVWR